jgi:hypothetical protein
VPQTPSIGARVPQPPFASAQPLRHVDPLPRLPGSGCYEPVACSRFLVIVCRYLVHKEVATHDPASALPVRSREQHWPQGSQIDHSFDGQAPGRVGVALLGARPLHPGPHTGWGGQIKALTMPGR